MCGQVSSFRGAASFHPLHAPSRSRDPWEHLGQATRPLRHSTHSGGLPASSGMGKWRRTPFAAGQDRTPTSPRSMAVVLAAPGILPDRSQRWTRCRVRAPVFGVPPTQTPAWLRPTSSDGTAAELGSCALIREMRVIPDGSCGSEPARHEVAVPPNQADAVTWVLAN